MCVVFMGVVCVCCATSGKHYHVKLECCEALLA